MLVPRNCLVCVIGITNHYLCEVISRITNITCTYHSVAEVYMYLISLNDLFSHDLLMLSHISFR